MVLHEALAAGDCDVVRLVVDALNSEYTASYALKAALMETALQQMCDFVAHVSWKLISWMPLVGWFLPSDTIKITKPGNAFRIDTNLVGMNTVQPVYLRVTVLFLGTKRLLHHTDT